MSSLKRLREVASPCIYVNMTDPKSRSKAAIDFPRSGQTGAEPHAVAPTGTPGAPGAPAVAAAGPNPLFLREEALRQGIELLFFGYRDFIAEPDQILAEKGLGRAHHRVIYFVGRYPGMTVSDLLGILRITKQSLSRVLSQLIEQDYVDQREGEQDRRQRLLSLTDKGKTLEGQLTENQRRRIARAFKEAGAEAVEGFEKVMRGVISDSADRARFSSDGRRR